MPFLRESYRDLRAAVEGADLLVSHVITYTARLVAETTGILWVSTMLSPIGFFSAHDPPVLPPASFRTSSPWQIVESHKSPAAPPAARASVC